MKVIGRRIGLAVAAVACSLLLLAPARAGPVSHWALDDDGGFVATDSAGPYPGTLGPVGVWVKNAAPTHFNYTAPTWTAGKIGGALQFVAGAYNPGDGNAGDAVMVPDAPEFNSPNLSLSFWANTVEATAVYYGYVTKGWGDNIGDPGGWSTDSWDLPGGIQPQLQDDGGGFHPAPTPFTPTWIGDGHWHSFVMTYDSPTTTLKGFIDGALVATSTTAVLGVSPKDVMFGGDAYSSTSYTGLLDDIGYWTNRLTDAQAISLFDLGDIAVLNYDLGEAQQLWDRHAAGSGSTTIAKDGRMWFARRGGLSGGLGQVIDLGEGDYELQLDPNGGGVSTIIPEPSSVTVLTMGALVLLAHAWWRRRCR